MQVLISLRLSRFSESLRDQRALSLNLFHFATVRNHVSAFSTRGAATAQVRSVTRGELQMKQVDCWLFTATYLFPDARLWQLIHPGDVCVPSSPPTGSSRLKVVQLSQTLRVPRSVCERVCVWTPVLTFRFLAPCARCLEMLPLKRSVYICRHYTHNFTPVALSPFAFAFSVHIIIYSRFVRMYRKIFRNPVLKSEVNEGNETKRNRQTHGDRQPITTIIVL